MEPIFPYVSDAGASPPQASYFSMSLDLVAVLGIHKQKKSAFFAIITKIHLLCFPSSVFLTAIARFRQLRYLIHLNFVQVNHADASLENRLHCRNRIALLLSSSAALCLLAVGNFRTTESNRVHTTAAFAMFTLNLLYFSWQYRLSRSLFNRFGVESPPTTLLIFTLLGIVSYLICFAGSTVSMVQFGEERFFADTSARMHWRPADPGYLAHVVGTVAEWVAINSIPLMYLCLCRRMRRFERASKV